MSVPTLPRWLQTLQHISGRRCHTVISWMCCIANASQDQSMTSFRSARLACRLHQYSCGQMAVPAIADYQQLEGTCRKLVQASRAPTMTH